MGVPGLAGVVLGILARLLGRSRVLGILVLGSWASSWWWAARASSEDSLPLGSLGALAWSVGPVLGHCGG